VGKALRELNKSRVLTIQITAKTIGFLVAAIPATVYGKAHYQKNIQALQDGRFDFDAHFSWTEACRADLEWWLSPSHTFLASFRASPTTTTLTTNVSLEGWGAIWEGNGIRGAWEDMICGE
jgi:hypothetical protein